MKRRQHLNFAYVLPDVEGARTRIIIPSALQMGWVKSLPFFCAATETSRDIAEYLASRKEGSLASHPLEYLMIPPTVWSGDRLADTCHRYLKVMEIYVDDFCTMVQTSNIATLRYISRALLHAIHDVLPPPAVSRHSGGDPVSNKKY